MICRVDVLGALSHLVRLYLPCRRDLMEKPRNFMEERKVLAERLVFKAVSFKVPGT